MRLWKYTFAFLLLILALVFIAIFQIPDSRLHVIACDVGQGDAILAVYKNVQILTDGGPDKKVVDCLGRYMPFWDREVEVVINTHPQLDHYGGLVEVFRKYKVDNFIANALDSSASEYQVLKREVGRGGVKVINPLSGMYVRYDLMHLDIFWPSFAFLASEGAPSIENKLGTFTSKRDPNDFSVQAILSLGEFDALLTGDIGYNMADEVLRNFVVSDSRTIEYIKVPHHGSKNGLTQSLLEKIVPGGLPLTEVQHEPSMDNSEKANAKPVGVISVGRKNRYGHPAPEILEILKEYGIKTLRTDQMGNVEVVTDGKSFWVKNKTSPAR